MADRALYQKGKATWDGYLKKPHHLDLSGIKVPKGVYSMTFWKESTETHFKHKAPNVVAIYNNSPGNEKYDYFEKLDSGNQHEATSMSFRAKVKLANGEIIDRAPWFNGNYWHTDRNVHNVMRH